MEHLSDRLWEKGKLILFDVSLLKEKYFFIKNISWLIKLRCNSVSINKALLELLSIYYIVVVQKWKSTTLKMMSGIKDVYNRIRRTIKLLKSEHFAIRIHFTVSLLVAELEAFKMDTRYY